MKACMVENGMQFDEKEVSDLATALFEDAVQVMTPQKFVASKNKIISSYFNHLKLRCAVINKFCTCSFHEFQSNFDLIYEYLFLILTGWLLWNNS